MNIVILNDFASINGGASRIVLGSAAELAKSGDRVLLFAAAGPVDPEVTRVPGLEVICLEQFDLISDPIRLRAALQGYWNPLASKRLASSLRAFSPRDTIVHVHMWTKALSSSVVRVALDRGFQVVVTLHDYFIACPAGTFFNYPRREICTLQPMSMDCIRSNCDARSYSQKLWRVGRQKVQMSFGYLPQGVRHYISISKLSETILAPLLPPQACIHRVPNFVDSVASEPVEVSGNTVFTFSGRLSAEKGGTLFASACKEVGARALFIGEGPERSSVEQILPSTTITGWLPPDQALSTLRRSRALVFPSLWYETQGLVVTEAASMGIPAIVPDTSAAREWVVDGVTGLWFKGGNVSDLAAKIAALQDDETCSRMGQQAYRHYWDNPVTRAQHATALREVYCSILAL